MGLNLSRPQYGYYDEYYRVHPADYFRRCDPEDCFCGQTHTRQRHVAVNQSPGGQITYRDPMQMMDGMLMSGMYGGGGGYGMQAAMPYTAMSPGGTAANVINMPSTRAPPAYAGWPPEWKDPRDWTTRDYNRLGEIMDEYLCRQRGRNLDAALGAGMPMYNPMMSNPMMPNPMMPNPMMRDPMAGLSAMGSRPMLMDDGWPGEQFDRRASRRASLPLDFEQLREQMLKYAEDAKEHAKTTNDFLFGSEREMLEARYKDRQRKMIEEILRTLGINAAGNQSTASTIPAGANPGMTPGMNPMMGMNAMPPMNPWSAMGNMAGMSAMGGVPFFPPMAGPDPMGFGGMRSSSASRYSRPRRPPRGVGFGNDYDDDDVGGFGRRGRKTRGGFGNDDDLFNLDGDGRRGPKDPLGPRKPRPDTGGGGSDPDGYGAFFDAAPKAPQAERMTQPFDAMPTVSDSWAPPYRTTSPPPIPPRPKPSMSSSWPEPSLGKAPDYGRAPDYRLASTPPPYDSQTAYGRERWDSVRPRVSFQDPPATSDNPPAGPSRYRIVNDGT